MISEHFKGEISLKKSFEKVIIYKLFMPFVTLENHPFLLCLYLVCFM